MVKELSRDRTPYFSLRDLYYVLFRHKKRIIAFFVAALLITVVVTFFATPIYRSEAKLMIRLGRESVSLDPTATTGKIVNIGQERESEINSEIEILDSRELAEKVVDDIGVTTILYGPPASMTVENAGPIARFINKAKAWARVPLRAVRGLFAALTPHDPYAPEKLREKAIISLMQDLNIYPIKKSNVIFVSYEAASPTLAHDVVRKLIHYYLEKHISAHKTVGSYQFFDEQTKQLKKELEETEKKLNELKNQTQTGSIQEQKTILLKRIGELRRDIQNTESSLSGSAAKIQALKTRLEELPATLEMAEITGFPNSAADDLLKRLNNLKLKEQELLSTFTENSVPVKEVRRQIAEAEALLRKTSQIRQVTKGINLTYQEVQKDLVMEEGNFSALRAKAETLKAQLAEAKKELNTLNDTEALLAAYERKKEMQEANYRKYVESLEQARIDQALETEKISNISVVQRASLPLKPIWPRKKLNLVLGLFLGIFGSITLAFFSEYMDHTFKKPEDVEQHLQLPTLVTIPEIDSLKGGELVSHIAFQSFYASASADSTTSFDYPSAVRNHDETSWNQMLLSSEIYTKTPLILAITSCYEGEGVSTVSSLLANLLAVQSDGRVLLVDANFHKPSLHRLFGVDTQFGLADMLAHDNLHTTIIRSSNESNLDLLCAGEKPQRSRLILGRKEFVEFLNLIKREYSYVVFDTPALTNGSMALKLGTLVDGTILVIEAERVRWEVAQRAKEKLEQTNAGLLGVVLNKRRFYVPEWLYRRL